jgi:hypothetical protein
MVRRRQPVCFVHTLARLPCGQISDSVWAAAGVWWGRQAGGIVSRERAGQAV